MGAPPVRTTVLRNIEHSPVEQWETYQRDLRVATRAAILQRRKPSSPLVVLGQIRFGKMSDWVGEVTFSPEVEAKLRSKHNLTPTEIRSAIAWGNHAWAVWNDHPEYGRRLVVSGRSETGSLVAYLRPIDREDGLWECLTAWRIA